MLPNFIIAGAPKCGTTSLHDYLAPHPQIFMSKVKELHYFDNYPPHYPLEKYQEAFIGSENFAIRGESTPLYMGEPTAPEQMAKILGQPKLAFILRDPVARAHSHYWFRVHHKRQDPKETFSDLIRSDVGKQRYLYIGEYHARLQDFLRFHPRENIYVGLQEELKTDGKTIVKEVCRFLNVSDDFEPDLSYEKNVTRIVKNEAIGGAALKAARVNGSIEKGVYKILDTIGLQKPAERLYKSVKSTVRDMVMTGAPQITAEDAAYLRDYYREDILRLQDFLGRDLSRWLR